MFEGVRTNRLPESLERAGDIQVEIKVDGTPLSELSKSLGLNDQDLRILMAGNGSEIRKGDKYRRENHGNEIVVYKIRNGDESVVCSIPKEIIPHIALPMKMTRQEDGYYKIGDLTIAPQNREEFTSYLGTLVNKYINYMVNRNGFDRVMDAGREFLGSPEQFFKKLDYGPLIDFFGSSKLGLAKTKLIAIIQSIDKN